MVTPSMRTRFRRGISYPITMIITIAVVIAIAGGLLLYFVNVGASAGKSPALSTKGGTLFYKDNGNGTYTITVDVVVRNDGVSNATADSGTLVLDDGTVITLSPVSGKDVVPARDSETIKLTATVNSDPTDQLKKPVYKVVVAFNDGSVLQAVVTNLAVAAGS